MAVPIEGYTVIAQRKRISQLLEDNAIEIPNSTAVADDDIWRCSFMAESDANRFLEQLAALELNTSQGPDSDAVLVNEFDRSVHPYCEWLVTAQWEKAVIAWKVGTQPKTVVAPEGWDPKVGSGLSFHDPSSDDELEFLRLEDRVEVYLNKRSGEEVYIGRTAPSLEAMFKTAVEAICEHFVAPGESPLSGPEAEAVQKAIASLDEVIAEMPDAWNVHWYRGKGLAALGDQEQAYQAFRRAFELEPDEAAIPRELAGACLLLGHYEEAISAAERAVTLIPEDAGLLGNLALAYLLAGRTQEATKTITAAVERDSADVINAHLQQLIAEVASGTRPQPNSLDELPSP